MRDFAGNWTGTGTISGSGDAETICLEEGQYMESEIVSTGDQYVELFQNLYNGAGDDVVMKYRTGATTAACFVAPWEVYYTPFQSSGYAQVRLESTLTLELSVSQDGRYLTKGGSPWLMIADSPQGIMSDCTPAQMATYMANRQGYGINLIQVHLLSGATFGGNSTTFQAQDGTTPFTTTGDIRTPREAYFAQVDDMLNLAASYNMIVMLTAAENIDAQSLFTARTVAECRTFGQYLGNRYKDFPNLIWNFGNDYTTGTAAVDDAYQAVQAGVRDNDSNHLHTVWLFPPPVGSEESSRESSEWNALIDLDFVYLYTSIYDTCLGDYAMTPAMPLFMGESNYEGESLVGYETLPIHIRKQHYWSLLSGACGSTYCNEDIWKFVSGWATRLDSYPGLTHTEICANLFKSVSWWLLVPDNAHDVLTAGYGTYAAGGSINTNDYATCAYLTDGSLAIIYMPTNRTMTADMSFFNGTVTCRWYDPTDGSYTADAASPHTNSGTHDFSRSGANAGGDNDWVLVLET